MTIIATGSRRKAKPSNFSFYILPSSTGFRDDSMPACVPRRSNTTHLVKWHRGGFSSMVAARQDLGATGPACSRCQAGVFQHILSSIFNTALLALRVSLSFLCHLRGVSQMRDEVKKCRMIKHTAKGL